MTDQITVPRETWGALREALEKSRSARTYSERIEAHECAVLALTAANAVSHPKTETAPVTDGGAITAESAANAVSAEPKVKLIPTAEEMGTPVQPQAQDGVFGWLLTNGTFTSSEAEQISHDCRNTDKAIALYAHPQATDPAWRPIETAPKDGRKTIVTYANRNGLKRTVMACWLTDESAAETDTDDVGLEEGWYECIDNWNDYTEIAIHEGEPTHWMPLPSAPEAKQ